MHTVVRRAGGLVAVAGLTATALAGCTSATASALRLHVTPARALFDVPVSVSVTGLAAGERIKLETRSTARDGTVWSATARFTADRSGTVTTRQAPTSGDYRGVDPMALFADAAPHGDPTQQAEFLAPADYRITVQALVDGRRRVARTITRLLPQQAGVTTRQLRPTGDDGLYGEYFAPRSISTPRPALVVVGGSEGGLATTLSAGELAAHGFPALALAYFAEPGLPAELDRVPLEYFAKAFTWLARQRGVDRQRMAMWGTSRGSEAALLTAAHYPALVHGVVAASPSDIAFESYPGGGDPAWTFGGKGVPTASNSDFSLSMPSDPAALIPVTAVRGPIFAVCGEQDRIWPSCAHVASIQRRLAVARSPYRPTVVRFADAGHYVGDLLPYFPNTNTAASNNGAVSGTVHGDERGRVAGFAALLHWLATLPRPG